MPDIRAMLEQEATLVDRLMLVLAQEQDALSSATPEGLGEMTQERLSLVDQINRLETERNAALARQFAGLAPAAAMAHWLGGTQAGRTATPLWEQLLDKARMARQQLDINASLIRLHLEKTGQALDVLRSNEHRAPLYGSDGYTAGGSLGRISDSA